KGLDFYDRLVDGLLEAGITPMATLYHWDLPQVLQEAGGWPARATVDAFVEYTDVVTRRLGDRVGLWVTHNEPWCISILGYSEGKHAPGHHDWGEALRTAHHLMVSHGMAVPVIRSNSPGCQVGLVNNLVPAEPASPSEADREACRWFDGFFNRWFLDPLYHGRYPEDMVRDYTAAGHLGPGGLDDFVHPDDFKHTSVPTDFLGVNYYSRAVVRSEQIPDEENAPRTVQVAPEEEWTEMGWEVYPDGLRQILHRVHRDYAPGALYITENGASWSTKPDADGRVRDRRRQHYICEHLKACRQAIAEGVPLEGYFVWSLLDNFEWGEGYTQRFGLVWVDYATQERILKDSALWYRDSIAANRVLPIAQETTPS
ncbi:MAG: family 1 glycosylhydrolase, partial [Myxococcota bacterium]